MNAKDKAKIVQLSEAAGALALHSVAEHVRGTLEQSYTLGFDAGKLAGIEEGRASAAGLIAGLRQLLGGVEGFAVPAGLPPMLTTDQVLDPITAGRIAEAGRQVVGANVVRELVDLSTGEIFEEPATEPGKPEADELGKTTSDDKNEQLLQDNPAVNFPGYFPLDLPFGSCELCEGFGTIQGELYGQPCMIPCSCAAGDKVVDVATLGDGTVVSVNETAETVNEAPPFDVDDVPEVQTPEAKVDPAEEPKKEGDFEAFCFRLDCVNHDTKTDNGCKQLEHVEECEHRVGPLGVLCGNTTCSSYDVSKMTRCYAVADMAELGTIQAVTSCGKFKKAPGEPFTPTFSGTIPGTSSAAGDDSGERYECCKACLLNDPDCSECSLVEMEIERRNAAGNAEPIELAKCGNGSCTATGKDAKDVCLRISIEGRPGKDCGSFVPLADCSHLAAKRHNDESGSLVCGVCGKVLQESRRAAAGSTSPEPAGASQAAADPSPADAKKAALQAKCPHPANFMNVIPGRGEVCTICDLVLTPESLPLFDAGAEAGKIVEIAKGAPDAATYFGGEELEENGDECDHLPLDVRYTEPVTDPESGETIGEREMCGLCGAVIPEEKIAPECLHPAEARRPEPYMKDGERLGSLVKCGECGKVVARFDVERKPIPPELWPENGAEIGAADIRKHGYRPDELKMIKAGFSLIRYDREDKNLYKTCNDPALGRFLVLHGKTYADCERKLAEELKDAKLVQVNAIGQAATSKDEAKLRAAGFEFYRYEKASQGVNPKIKVGSKNWGMLAKYKTDQELGAAWKKLMSEDPFALEG